MPWRGPEFEGEFPSLGWELLGWTHEYLPSPADEREPLVLTNEQVEVFVRWFAIDPEIGEFVYRRGGIEMAKGWGKSPFAGVIALCELAAPVLFGGWDAHGEPVGRPWGSLESPPAWIQIAAVSEDQTENTYGALYAMLTANESRTARVLGIDEGRTRLYRGQAKLEPVTASAGSREGQRLTFGVLDETQLWVVTNGGVKLARTIRRNAAKMGGRTLDTSNAPALDEDSVAETPEQAGPGVFHYAKRPSVEPSIDMPDERLVELLGEVYGDARWIDLQRIVAEIRDPETTWEDALRYYFNVRAGLAEHFLPGGSWEARKAEHVDPEDGAYVTLGFSGSADRLSAGVVLIVEGQLQVLDSWEGKRPVPSADLNAVVEKAFERWHVETLACNPTGFDAEVEAWAERYGQPPVVPFEVRKRAQFAQACGEFFSAVIAETLTHDDDSRLRRHLQNARPRHLGEDRYIVDGPGGPATLVKAAVVAWTFAGDPSREPMVAYGA